MSKQKITCFFVVICVAVLCSIVISSCSNFFWPIKIQTNEPVKTSSNYVSIPGADPSIELEMITLKFSGGYDTFVIGEDVEDDAQEISVKSFSLAKYELSYNLWYHVYVWATSSDRGENVYTFAHKGSEGTYFVDGDMTLFTVNDGVPETTGMPVCKISARDATIWCNAFSEMCGLKPVYYTDKKMKNVMRNACFTVEEGGVLSSYDKSPGACIETAATVKEGGIDNPYINLNANGYRLPFEAEWEYAARKKADGSFISGKYASGDSSGMCGNLTSLDKLEGLDYPKSSVVAKYAWYNNTYETPNTKTNTKVDDSVLPSKMRSTRRTHKQGTKLPTELGFCDMSGNINEWCNDFAKPYSSTRKTYSLKSCRGGMAWFDVSLVQSGVRRGQSMYEGSGGMRLAQSVN